MRTHLNTTHEIQRKNNGQTMRKQREVHNGNARNKVPNVCRIYARITPIEANKLHTLTKGGENTISDVIRQLIQKA